MNRRARYLLEYAGLRSGLSLVRNLPLPVARSFVVGIADLWFTLNRTRRRVAMENVRLSGVADAPGEISRIARASFSHLGVVVVEYLRSGDVITPDNWRDHVEIDFPPSVADMLSKADQGIIIASGHIGNWQLAIKILSYNRHATAIARKMDNPYTDALLLKEQNTDRLRITPKHGSNIRQLMSDLKKGELLALLIDQHARERSMVIDFLGRPASAHTAPALFHLMTGVPLCFGYCLRTGPMTYRMRAAEPIIHKPTGNRQDDIRAILTTLNGNLEKAVHESPEQYLWAHRRWRKSTP